MKNSRGLLSLFSDPLLIMTTEGQIVGLNAAGERLAGKGRDGSNTLSVLASPPDELREWLWRCSGTTGPLVGALVLRGSDGLERHIRAFGARLEVDGRVRIAVRCSDPKRDRFSVLKKEVAQLNAEARERSHRQAMLEEALRFNDLLLREVNHRVKNNIQIMLGLVSAALRDAGSPEVTRVLEVLQGRLFAVAAVQDIMYQAQQACFVSAAPFVRAVAVAVGDSLRPGVTVEIAAVEGQIRSETAFPLALILNELVTNAAKHGLPKGRETIRIAFERRGNLLSLVVQDNGPGIPEPVDPGRSSGMGLVQGLCRQIGARLKIDNGDGARVTVEVEEDEGPRE